MRTRDQDELQTGTVVNGLPTCVFPAKTYSRVITKVVLGNSATSSVLIYRGIVGNVVANNSFGRANTMRGEINVPAGQTVFIQWSRQGASASEASATISWDREDNPLESSGGFASGIDWDTETEPTEASGRVIVKVRNLSIAGPQDYGTHYVGNLPYLHVYAFAGVNMEIKITWFSDATLVGSIAVDFLVFSGNGPLNQCVPIKGSYARFDVQRAAYPGTIVLEISSVPVPLAVVNTVAGLQGSNALLSVSNAAIGAGATIITNAVVVRGGWITWSCEGFLTPNFWGRLVAVDFSGAALTLDTMYYPPGSGNRLTFAPALPLQIWATNTDAAAHTYSAHILHHPFYP